MWRESESVAPDCFERMTYADAMERYGSDRPDTRYDLEIIDASEVFRGADFAITKAALEKGGRVRGIRIPGGAAALSRKHQDEIEADAKKAGALGLLRLKFANGALEGPVAKFLARPTPRRSSVCRTAISRCSSPGPTACRAPRWIACGRMWLDA